MTQTSLLINYLKTHKTIMPAKMAGSIFMKTMFGSETGRRARQLRAKGILNSFRDGRFQVYFLKKQNGSKKLQAV